MRTDRHGVRGLPLAARTWFIDLGTRALNKLRVRSGELNTTFHHYRLGWTEAVSRIVSDSPRRAISLPDPFNSSTMHTHCFQERSIWKIRGATVQFRTGLILVNGNAVRDSIRSHAERKMKYAAFHRLKRSRRFDQPIVFAAHNPRNYYHWLLEDLPSLLRAKAAAPDAAVVLGGHQPDYVRTTLEIAGISNPMYTFRDLRKTDLVFAGQGDDTGWPHPDDVELVKEKLAPKDAPYVSPAHGIYLTRPPGRRAYRNEKEVCAFMSRHGVRIVSPEKLSFAEQVLMFSSANVIVGAHGAALTNIIFCRPGTRMLELAPESRAIQTFECLASYGNLKYKRILVPVVGSSEAPQLAETQLDQVSEWLRVTQNS